MSNEIAKYGALTLLACACVANDVHTAKVVGGPSLSPEEEAIPVQLLSAAACDGDRQEIYQCSGLRIAPDAFVSAGHCYKPGRSYYVLSSYKMMQEIRAIGSGDSGVLFQKSVPCGALQEYLNAGLAAGTVSQLDNSEIFVAAEYTERIEEKTASPQKMAHDLAVVKTESPALSGYPVFRPLPSRSVAANTSLRFYGTGLSNCFVEEDGEIRKARSSKLEQATKEMGIGRVDALVAGPGEVEDVIHTEYSGTAKQRDLFTTEAELVSGLIFLRNKADNFPCGGDSGSGYIVEHKTADGRSEPGVVAIHRASVYSHTEVPYSVGVRLDSPWSCALFAEAGVTVQICPQNDKK